jgi:two-component system, cell cycle sensor histidine kinase and response regulator CckA
MQRDSLWRSVLTCAAIMLAAVPLLAGDVGKAIGLYDPFGWLDPFDVLGLLALTAIAVKIHRGRLADVRAAQKLQISDGRYHNLFDQTRDLIAVFDSEGRLCDLNAAAERTLGYSRADLLGAPLGVLTPPELVEDAVTRVRQRLDGSQPSGLYRTVLVAKDGTRVPVETSSQPLGGPEAPDGLLVTARDLRDRVAAEQEMAQLEEQFRQAQKMEAVGRLAGGVAHDFNNLLTVIGGYAGIALHKLEGGTGSAELAGVIDAADKAAALTAQLLAFSRRQVLDPQTFDLGRMMQDLTGMLRRMIPSTIEIVTACPAQPVLVRADRGKLEQVVMNLAVNARDALPGGGTITIEVAAENAAALLRVADDGVGMDPATLQQIFEPFFSTKGMEGTGLGLAMAHGIVAQSGGLIGVESSPGEGTTFTVSLPLADADVSADETVVPVSSPSQASGGETILLVDDDAAVRTVVAAMLNQHGYRLLTAAGGEQALALAQAEPGTIDLLLTDLVMPGMNGRETAEAVRASQPQEKVLFMSGYTDDTVVRHGGYEPGIAFIQKPFSSDELNAVLTGLLDTVAA